MDAEHAHKTVHAHIPFAQQPLTRFSRSLKLITVFFKPILETILFVKQPAEKMLITHSFAFLVIGR